MRFAILGLNENNRAPQIAGMIAMSTPITPKPDVDIPVEFRCISSTTLLKPTIETIALEVITAPMKMAATAII